MNCPQKWICPITLKRIINRTVMTSKKIDLSNFSKIGTSIKSQGEHVSLGKNGLYLNRQFLENNDLLAVTGAEFMLGEFYGSERMLAVKFSVHPDGIVNYALKNKPKTGLTLSPPRGLFRQCGCTDMSPSQTRVAPKVKDGVLLIDLDSYPEFANEAKDGEESDESADGDETCTECGHVECSCGDEDEE